MEDSTVVWMGIQGYIAGMKGRQDDQGNMIGMSPPFVFGYRVGGMNRLTEG